jgi:hypothetical protein
VWWHETSTLIIYKQGGLNLIMYQATVRAVRGFYNAPAAAKAAESAKPGEHLRQEILWRKSIRA